MIANDAELDQLISEEAYYLWQADGERQGRDGEYWELARGIVSGRQQPEGSRSATLGAVLADLSFGAGGNGVSCLRDGWGIPETDFVWAVRETSCIEIARPDGVQFSLELIGRGLGADPPQRVRISANGVEIGQTEFGAYLAWTLPIPRSILGTAPSLLLDLRFPKTTSPREVGFGEDDRQLGLALVRLVLRRTSEGGAGQP